MIMLVLSSINSHWDPTKQGSACDDGAGGSEGVKKRDAWYNARLESLQVRGGECSSQFKNNYFAEM